MLIKKKFYFARHGETDYNRNSLCTGIKINPPLNKTGESQAIILKEKINLLDIRKVVSSPLKRAIQTANLITIHPIVIEHDIRECNFGTFEGKPASECLRYIQSTPSHIPFPGGESREDVTKRVKSGVNKILLSYGDNILFVSHGIVYGALLEETNNHFDFIRNCELIQFKPEKDSWIVVRL